MRVNAKTAFILALTTILLVSGLTQGSAQAQSTRLHVLQFNACDQYQAPTAPIDECFDNDRLARATAIVDTIVDWQPNVVALQEVCWSTVSIILNQLPIEWVARRQPTVNVSDQRCGPDVRWGLAVLSRASISSFTALKLYDVPSTEEDRYLLCAVTVAGGLVLRFCSTHLAASNDALRSQQLLDVANEGGKSTRDGVALLTMGDFNIDVKQCMGSDSSVPPAEMRILYDTAPYGSGNRCIDAVGRYFEFDEPHPGGDGDYVEPTFQVSFAPDRKLDYIFANPTRFDESTADSDATGSVVSDHDPMRGEVTLFSCPTSSCASRSGP